MSKGKRVSSEQVNSKDVKQSFWERYKTDKKYNAKVQLMGYGIFIVVLVIYLNLSGISSGSTRGNNIIGNTVSNGFKEGENTSLDDTNLLENLGSNYNYDIKISFDKLSMNISTNEEVEIEHNINYIGKSYGNKLEIKKDKDGVSSLYYKVDNKYYSMIDNITTNVKDTEVYDIVNSSYIELDGIMNLINNASLDHVTNFSSGKKEYVYHYKVLSSNSSNYDNNIIEINVEEDNDILKIEIDYTNLFKEIDDTIVKCELEAVVSDIDLVEDFEVIVSDSENTSIE